MSKNRNDKEKCDFISWSYDNFNVMLVGRKAARLV